MGDWYCTADGWAVEVVELSATPDRNDGERLKVTYCGFFVALVRRVAELDQWFSLADLQLETLVRCRHLARGLAGFGPGLSAARGMILPTPRDRGRHADDGRRGNLAGGRRRNVPIAGEDRGQHPGAFVVALAIVGRGRLESVPQQLANLICHGLADGASTC
jgi:hypothetical protein